MTSRQFWTSTGLGSVIALAVIGAILKVTVGHVPAPSPSPIPVPAPQPDVQFAGIAPQKAKLQLCDGRAATFLFAVSAGTLSCTAAVGLDQVVSYDLLPVGDPAPPGPNPPNPPCPPAPTPAQSNLRVLFLYDPLALIDMPPGQQAVLASPQMRTYLDEHCPLESGCASGRCPLVSTAKTPSYRFLPSNADTARLTPVWQQTLHAAAGKPLPWMIVVNEAGQTVIDQAWPATVDETLKLLQKYGGP
jgi:hypothetical protein